MSPSLDLSLRKNRSVAATSPALQCLVQVKMGKGNSSVVRNSWFSILNSRQKCHKTKQNSGFGVHEGEQQEDLRRAIELMQKR